MKDIRRFFNYERKQKAFGSASILSWIELFILKYSLMVAKMAYGYILCFLFFQSLNCFMGREHFPCTNLLSNDWNAAKLKLDLFTATLNADLQRFCVLYTLSWTSIHSLDTMKWNYKSLHISIALILSFFSTLWTSLSTTSHFTNGWNKNDSIALSIF